MYTSGFLSVKLISVVVVCYMTFGRFVWFFGFYTGWNILHWKVSEHGRFTKKQTIVYMLWASNFVFDKVDFFFMVIVVFNLRKWEFNDCIAVHDNWQPTANARQTQIHRQRESEDICVNFLQKLFPISVEDASRHSSFPIQF